MGSLKGIKNICLQETGRVFSAATIFLVLSFFLLLPSLALAAAPQVICVPQLPTDLLVPHETWPNEPAILKGVARGVISGTYYWEFGDGEVSETLPISNPDNLGISHTYTNPAGTLLIARLHVIDNLGNETSDEYRILVKEKTLDIEVNKAIDDGLWWLYTNKESQTTFTDHSIVSGLTTPSGEPGILGEYYNNTSLEGDPVVTRIDSAVQFSWGYSPAPGIGYDYFSVRWTGVLDVETQDSYSFATISDDGVRLYVDGILVIDDWHDHGPTWNYAGAVTLAPGSHTIVLEYFERGGGASVGLYWGTNDTSHYWSNAGGMSPYYQYFGNSTASAVQAFQINGHLETGDPAEDPYVKAVQGGLKHLFENLSTYNISTQPAGDPDSNSNGIGLNWPGGRPIYELGAVMDAIVATGTPDAVAATGAANVIGRRYRDIVQDMVDMYAWGQDDAGNDMGGWRYGWNSGADNSAAQWGAIGMVAAERHFGCVVPTWVKERNNTWLNYSYNGTGFGYAYAGNGWATTPSGMVQLAFDGFATTDSRWQTAESYLANNWAEFLQYWSTHPGQGYYASYAFNKAMRLALPQEVTNLSTGFNWYADETLGMARNLLDRKTSEGCWEKNYWLGAPIITAWNVIILSRTLFEKPPVAVITGTPNPGALGQAITLDASMSYHVDPAKEITRYLWDLDASDGIDFDHPDATGITVSRAYGNLQDYTVSLKVIDNSTPERFDTTSFIVQITIPPHPPTAVIGGPYIGAVGESIQVDGSGSYDIDQSEGDFITAWDWESDMAAPYQYNEANGETALLPAFALVGRHDIILRVTDDTANVFPTSGEQNLTNTAFGEVSVYEIGVTDLAARPKATKCQLTWTHIGAALYEVLRSEKAPNEGFEQIGSTDSTYSTFIDYNVELNKDYWYRIRCEFDGERALSAPVHINSQGRIRNLPPVINSIPVTDAQENMVYEYDVEATDPEGTTLTFILDQAPDGMSIDSGSGLITWTPEFIQAGVHDVMIRVQDARRSSATQFFQIVVTPRPNSAPEVNHGGPYSGLITNPITFSGNAVDPEGDSIALYRWAFGDGTEASGSEVTHTYMASGTYIVTLFVTDERGATGHAETGCQIEFPNRAPIAGIGGPYSGVVNTELTFDGSSSYDADADQLTYTWNFGDSTPAVTGVEAQHTYTTPGTYNVSLSVDDGRGGLDTAEMMVIITPPNQAPTAAFSTSGIIARGHTITFDGTGSSDPEGRPLSRWQWDFGDGMSTTGALVTHEYSAAGDYRVELTVTDVAGATHTAGMDLHVIILSVEVPDLSNLAEAEARAAITGAALIAASATYDHSPSVPDGQVMNQSPEPGEMVEENSLVHFTLSSGPLMITVPDLTGMTEEAAIAALEGALLTTGTVTTVAHATVSAGEVINQNPTAGVEIEEGGAVNIIVSAGPSPLPVVDVVNMTQAAAQAAIAAAGFAAGTISNDHSLTVPAGNVIAQDPKAGVLAPPGFAVDLVISSGPLMITVPDVVNLEQSTAEQAITDAELVVGIVTTALSETVPQGVVLSQNPASGSVLQEQSPVDLVISAGPDAVQTPNLVGMTQEDGESTIAGLGLVVGSVSFARNNVVAQGHIISQSPSPGDELPPGSLVNFVVCLGPHVPTTLEIKMDSNVTTGGSTFTISSKVYDDTGLLMILPPEINYEIQFNAEEVSGTVPAISGVTVSTDIDTRGPYMLVASVAGFPAVTSATPFTVLAGGEGRSMSVLYCNLSQAMNTVRNDIAALTDALENNDITAMQNAIDSMRAARDGVNLEDLRRSAAFAPEHDFPPTVADLQAKGITQGADDAAYKETIKQIVSLIRHGTDYLNSMDAGSDVDDEAVQVWINDRLQTAVEQLNSLQPTIYGLADARIDLNYLMGVALPKHLHALVNRLESEFSSASLITMSIDPMTFYKQLLSSITPSDMCAGSPVELYYGSIKPAFFSLADMSIACKIRSDIMTDVYGPGIAHIARATALMAAQGLLNKFMNNAGMPGIITGASLSFHAFNMGGSVIEINGGFNREYPERNEVYLVGPDQVNALVALMQALDPRDIDSLTDLYDYFTGIRTAIREAGESVAEATQPPDYIYQGCILDWSDSCIELVYNNGFNSVYTCEIGWFCPPAPVLFIAHDPDNGGWAFSAFNFVASY